MPKPVWIPINHHLQDCDPGDEIDEVCGMPGCPCRPDVQRSFQLRIERHMHNAYRSAWHLRRYLRNV
jgi:hypothetical protein